MSKLTLSVDSSVVKLAKRYAKQRGVSVSAMVEAYLASISSAPEPPAYPPILQSLLGILHKADPEDYKLHLARKYR